MRAGWYQKGQVKRYVYGSFEFGMIKYRIGSGRKILWIHPSMDHWFKNSEYLGSGELYLVNKDIQLTLF